MSFPRFAASRTGRSTTTAIAGALLAVVMAAAVSGCRESRRVPRIDPTLRNWPDSYAGVEGLEVHAFDTGTLALPKATVFRGGSWLSNMDLPATAFVISHPTEGLIVFDTGFNERIYESPNDYIGFATSIVGSFAMADRQDLVSQMRDAGFDPDNVSHVVLSHMHFDHTGSVEAFANADVVVAYDELQDAVHDSSLVSFFRDEDFDEVREWTEVDFEDFEPYATFRSAADLLGDGSLLLIDLSGHTAGSMGLMVFTTDGPVLLTGDAAYVEESWRFSAVPLLADDMDLWWEQVWRIKKFAQLVPSALIIPGHDLRILDRVEMPTVHMHEFSIEKVDS
jgi:glyoxylase-like metal-dependent hydrolase (beta-lactamase superfamily II)